MQDVVSIEQTNGHKAHHQNGGRSVPDYAQFTFKDTGRTIGIKQKVSPYFGDKLRKRYIDGIPGNPKFPAHPEPKPPVERIVNDAEGGSIEEELINDPKYMAAHQKWENEYRGWAYEETLKYIFAVCVDPGTIDQAAVDAHKMYAGNDDNEDDTTIYLKYICPGSHHDLAELAQFVTMRSQPTSDQISEKVSTFRQDV